jgi:8-oxo-dGTP pyrophosphatase MutT (NUDIX family)
MPSLAEETATVDESPIPVSVKGVLLRKISGTAEVLLLRNDRNEWELPGGRPEAQETPEACLAREILEETGLSVEVGPLVQDGLLTISPPHAPKATNVLILAYGCHLAPDDVRALIALSSEHKSAGWIDVKDLPAMSDIPEIYKAAVLSWSRDIVR